MDRFDMLGNDYSKSRLCDQNMRLGIILFSSEKCGQSGHLLARERIEKNGKNVFRFLGEKFDRIVCESVKMNLREKLMVAEAIRMQVLYSNYTKLLSKYQ